MAAEYVARRFVEFSDTDMAGIVHFAHFFRYMEAAEHEFFRSVGLRLHQDHADGMEGWARVHAECDYERALTYGDTVEIHVAVQEVGTRSLTFAMTFRRPPADGATGEPEVVARGVLKTVHVTRASGESRMRATPIPPHVLTALGVPRGGPKPA